MSLTDHESALLARRVIELTGPITDERAEIVIAKLLYLHHLDAASPIHLRLLSQGGQVSAALAILDTMDFVSCPLHTLAMGGVSGIAVNILAHGTRGERVVVPFAKLTLVPFTGIESADRAAFDNTLETVVGFLARDTGRAHGEIAADLRLGRELDAEQARSYGIVDRVEQIDRSPPS